MSGALGAALVTGGGTGIGAAIAEELVARGRRVLLAGRRAGPLDAVARRLPAGAAATCSGDVADEADVRRMVEAAVALGDGRLDVVVNNAAAAINGTVESVPVDDWRRALDVNLTGPMLVIRHALDALRAAGGGAVVNVSSVAALAGNPGITPYATAKAGLLTLTRQCAIDFGRDGVRVNAVCPGWVRTEMSEEQMDGLARALGTDREGAFAAVTAHQPLRRVAAPAEIAKAVAFLAGDDAAYITGTVLTVDGGSTAVGPLGELLGGPDR